MDRYRTIGGEGGGGRSDSTSVGSMRMKKIFVQLPSDSFPTMKKKEIGSKASEQQSVRSIMPE